MLSKMDPPESSPARPCGGSGGRQPPENCSSRSTVDYIRYPKTFKRNRGIPSLPSLPRKKIDENQTSQASKHRFHCETSGNYQKVSKHQQRYLSCIHHGNYRGEGEGGCEGSAGGAGEVTVGVR